MGLTRIDVLKKINTYSMTDNKMGLIQILCEIFENEEFLLNNLDIVQIVIEIGELYGYNEYLKKYKEKLEIKHIDSTSSALRKIMFTSLYDKNVIFNSGQLSLLEEIKANKRIFISAPTSFGKTSLIFEHIYLNYQIYDNICVIVPTNSLEQELFYKFLLFNRKTCNKYKILTSPHKNKENSLYILTPEKYLLLNESNNIKFDLIVIDESYKIEDSEDEIKYNREDILNTRSSKYRMVFELCGASDSKLIFLSPYTYNKSESMLEFFNKYDVTFVDRTYNYVGHQIEDVSTQTKAQKLFNTTNISYKSDSAGIIKAVTILPYLNDSTIIYVMYPAELKKILPLINNDITECINTNDRFKKFYEHLVNNYTFDNSNWYVLEALKKGVGLYISPIPRYIKREILNLFNDGFLKVLVVTTAFAEGVNSSAKNIIITNEIAGANKKMTNLDMLNLSGRAGRFGKYSKGYIYAVKNTISERLKEAEKNGVTITNSNYEFPKNDKLRSDYEIDIIDEKWLTKEEIDAKKETDSKMTEYGLTDEDLRISLCTSRNTKLILYKYFCETNQKEKTDERYQVIKNLLASDRSDVIKSLEYVFNEIKTAGINISSDKGDIQAYSKNGKFLWGIFYAIHSSGNIKDILKRRKEYIWREYNSIISKDIELSSRNIEKILEVSGKKWLSEFISDGKLDDFKLYNNAFKFISSIIEYRIPFYIGLYVSIFKLFSKKNNFDYIFDFDIVDISTSLENKNIDEKYSNMLEYGLSLDMVKKIIKNETLDDFEKLMLSDYKSIYEQK